MHGAVCGGSLSNLFCIASSSPAVHCRYLQLDPGRPAGDWDAGLASATAEHETRMYNFWSDNCHCYVARFLNEVAYEDRRCGQ